VLEKLKELDPFTIDLESGVFMERIRWLNPNNWTETRIRGLEKEICASA